MDSHGQPDVKSREMVNAWVKRGLIKDFFELLSADGAGNSRRLDYWLSYEPLIEKMWFGLGILAQTNGNNSFSDFKKRALGRLLDLEGTTSENNAFVMQIGQFLLVEFGSKGNAMYIFSWDCLSQPLQEALKGGKVWASLHVRAIRDSENLQRLIHRDSTGKTWEQKFDEFLGPLVGRRPTPINRIGAPHRVRSAFNQTSWDMFMRTCALRVEDHRSRQGALWVLGVEQPSHVVAQLETWGFKRRAPKGWYRE